MIGIVSRHDFNTPRVRLIVRNEAAHFLLGLLLLSWSRLAITLDVIHWLKQDRFSHVFVPNVSLLCSFTSARKKKNLHRSAFYYFYYYYICSGTPGKMFKYL